MNSEEEQTLYRDRYGFATKSLPEDVKSAAKEWETVIKKGKGDFSKLDIQAIKPLIRRKGIPPAFRGHMWLALSGAKNYLSPVPYNEVLQTFQGKTSAYTAQIEKDIKRTFTDNVKFEHEGGITALKRVLESYSWINPEVGYCQSMNFIVAIFLLFMDEEDAFNLLRTSVERIIPTSYYAQNMIGALIDEKVLASLVTEKLPKIAQHFEKLQFDLANGFVSSWFMCLFVNLLPLESSLRVFDLLFAEGTKILFRVALAMLKMNEKKIVQTKSSEDIFVLLREIPPSISEPKKLFETAFNFEFLGSFSSRKIDVLRSQFRDSLQQREVEQSLKYGDALLLTDTLPSSPPPDDPKPQKKIQARPNSFNLKHNNNSSSNSNNSNNSNSKSRIGNSPQSKVDIGASNKPRLAQSVNFNKPAAPNPRSLLTNSSNSSSGSITNNSNNHNNLNSNSNNNINMQPNNNNIHSPLKSSPETNNGNNNNNSNNNSMNNNNNSSSMNNKVNNINSRGNNNWKSQSVNVRSPNMLPKQQFETKQGSSPCINNNNINNNNNNININNIKSYSSGNIITKNDNIHKNDNNSDVKSDNEPEQKVSELPIPRKNPKKPKKYFSFSLNDITASNKSKSNDAIRRELKNSSSDALRLADRSLLSRPRPISTHKQTAVNRTSSCSVPTSIYDEHSNSVGNTTTTTTTTNPSIVKKTSSGNAPTRANNSSGNISPNMSQFRKKNNNLKDSNEKTPEKKPKKKKQLNNVIDSKYQNRYRQLSIIVGTPSFLTSQEWNE